MIDTVLNHFRMSFFVTMLMPILAFIAYAIFRRLQDARTAQEKVFCLVTDFPRPLSLCLPSKIQTHRGDFSPGPMKVWGR
jgi:7-keto-8-aminopelargonate synthetase-like enzyme